MRLVRVVADDLTGACDVGGELLPLGRPVCVRSVTGRTAPAAPQGALWVANTQSRACAPVEAVRRVRLGAGPTPLGAGEIALKKIDTALRGHLAAELGAAMEALRPRLVLVAPAIPEVGRTTDGGRQLLGGVPVSETPFGADPVNPVRESNVVTVLATLGDVEVRSVPLGTVRDDAAYEALVRAAMGRARPVLVADAVRDGDLERSAAAVVSAGEPTLVVGSIGIARALVGALGSVGSRVVAPREDAAAAGTRGVLVACGSMHPAARGQLAALERRWGVPPCEVGRDAEESGRIVGEIVASSGLGVLCLHPGAGDPQVLGTAIGRAARAAVERQRPRGLILIGGETAYHCLHALGDPVLEVESRPMPLVVRSRIATGRWQGMRVLSKGGSAGDADAVNAMLALAEDGAWGAG
jgi:uncharacterized protein YgbK (DUF1537 family)